VLSLAIAIEWDIRFTKNMGQSASKWVLRGVQACLPLQTSSRQNDNLDEWIVWAQKYVSNERQVPVRRYHHNMLTIDKVLICLFRHPFKHVIRRWNWKAACMSVFCRGLLILFVNLSAGTANAADALLAEICYRALTSGFYSSITQAFRYVQPFWAASLATMALIPIISDTIELTVHILCGTQRISATFAASLIFTASATLIELFAMRHGILVVGENGKSLLQDFKNTYRLIVEYICEGRQFIAALIVSARKNAAVRR
jgi:hypothetical protein